MKIWAKTKEFSEGKYLVVRRDGTVPAWPHFVIGGDDPAGPKGIYEYANKAGSLGFEPEYVDSLYELANDFQDRVDAKMGKPDPDAPPHRTDCPLAISMMRGETDVATVASEITSLRTERDAARTLALHYQQAAVKAGQQVMRMRFALLILREWSMRNWDARAVLTVQAWIDEGMTKPLPWPGGAFFEEWAAKRGWSEVDGCVGFRLTAKLEGIKP